MNVYIMAASDDERDPQRKLRWGDHWFKESLAQAFRKLGHSVIEVADMHRSRPETMADVVINLHGAPKRFDDKSAWHVLWYIGHPDILLAEEYLAYDAVYAESAEFTEHLRTLGVDAKHLPGASDFEPLALPKTHERVFVGNWREERELPEGDGLLEVWGENWNHAGFLPKGAVWRGPEYPHDGLRELYASSREVVNQTYPDMERWGFHNPRYYDIAAVRGQKVPTFDECAAAIMAGVPGWRDMVDLGCSPKPRRGMWGLDIQGEARLAGEPTAAAPETIFYWDLERGLPHETHADVIVADNVLEHIDALIPLMNDCRGALDPKGRMHIIVPNAQNPDDAWADPTHRRAFVPGTFDYFNDEHGRWQQYGKGYGIKPWRVVYCRAEGRFIRVMLRPVVTE